MSLVVLFAASLFVTQSPPPLIEASTPAPTPATELTAPPLPVVEPAAVREPTSPAPTAAPELPASLAPPEPALSAPPPPPSMNEPALSAPPPPPPTTAASKAPLWELGAWATATIPTTLDGGAFMFGARAELDIWRIGVVASFDRVGVTPFTIGEVNSWNGLLGFSLVSTEFFRVRALGGFSALSGTSVSTRFAPAFGTTARVLWHFIGAEGAATFTAGAFRQLDLRAAVIVRGGIFELQVGYRARWLDATENGTIGTMFSTGNASTEQLTASAPTQSVLIGGPHLSIGLVF